MYFFKNTISEMVIDLQNAEREKRQRKVFQHLDDAPECFSKNCNWRVQNDSVNRNLELTPEIWKFFKLPRSLLFGKCHFLLTRPENIVILPSTYLQ